MAERGHEKIPQEGHQRPELKYLNRYVKPLVARKWYNLGVDLLEEEDIDELNTYEGQYPADFDKCCTIMFWLWLSKHPTASWNQLLESLRRHSIGFQSLATKVEKMLLKPKPSDVNNVDDVNKFDDDMELKIDFSAYEDVSTAFDVLFCTCQKLTKESDEDFEIIQNSCLAKAKEPLLGLMKCARDTNCLFKILAENKKYCNWLNVRFLTTIAIACGSKQLESLIKKYTDVIYSKPLREVWSCIPHYSVRDEYYSQVKAKFGDKDPDNMTIEELIKNEPKLAKEIIMLIAVVQEGSIVVTWLVPTDELYQAYLSFLTVPKELRMDELIQFGTWMAYPPQCVLHEYEKEIKCGTFYG